MSPTSRAAPLPPDERRAAIVAAAVPLVCTRGTATTTREIAEAAGVAEGTLFRVFADKDELIGAVIEAVFDPAPCAADLRRIDAQAPLPDVVAAAVEALRRKLDMVWQVIGMLRSADHTGHQAPTMGAARPELTQIEDALTDLLTDHRAGLRWPPRRAAHLLHMVTLAGAHPVLSAGDPASTSEIVDLLMHGLARDAATGAGAPERPLAASAHGGASC